MEKEFANAIKQVQIETYTFEGTSINRSNEPRLSEQEIIPYSNNFASLEDQTLIIADTPALGLERESINLF